MGAFYVYVALGLICNANLALNGKEWLFAWI